jgi:hypothetical protein
MQHELREWRRSSTATRDSPIERSCNGIIEPLILPVGFEAESFVDREGVLAWYAELLAHVGDAPVRSLFAGSAGFRSDDASFGRVGKTVRDQEGVRPISMSSSSVRSGA